MGLAFAFAGGSCDGLGVNTGRDAGIPTDSRILVAQGAGLVVKTADDELAAAPPTFALLAATRLEGAGACTEYQGFCWLPAAG